MVDGTTITNLGTGPIENRVARETSTTGLIKYSCQPTTRHQLTLSAEKVKATVLKNCQGIIFVEYLAEGTSITNLVIGPTKNRVVRETSTIDS